MPSVSKAQHNAMEAAAHGHSTLGIPKSVGKEFVAADGARLAAGVVFVAPDGDVLLLRRSADEKNYGGHWGLPGGGGDEGESAIDAAIREVREETGHIIDPSITGLKGLNKTGTPNGFVFHTFAKPVEDKFVPTLDAEHTGYCWASLDMLPQPLHPAVKDLLGAHIGVAKDMKPEQWAELRTNFAQWTREEEGEEEHANDNFFGDLFPKRSHDHALAFDEKSVRTYDVDGRLRVEIAHISKANVCPYWGHEIPNWQEKGLNPDRMYHLFRSPEELAKAAKSSDGIPLILGHVPATPDDHPSDDVVGAVGTSGAFNDPYLDNGLVIWTREGIDAVESEEAKELSCGYRYDADMTPGNYAGTPYDGVMRNIKFNHVALVPEGRAGADVVVGDSQIKLMEDTLSKTVLTRFAGASAVALGLYLKPKLAADAKIDLTSIFKGVTKKNFDKVKIANDVKLATKGKLAKDASLQDLTGMLDHLAQTEVAEGADEDPNSGLPMSKEDMEKKAKDEADKKAQDAKNAYDAFRASCSDEQRAAFDALNLGVRGADGEAEPAKKDADGEEHKSVSDETPEQKEAREKKEAEDRARDGRAMDAKINDRVKAEGDRIRAEMRGIQEAYSFVEPWAGKLKLGMDSAAAVYRAALKGLGMDAKRVDALNEGALKDVLEAQPKPGERRVKRAEDGAPQGNATGFNSRWGDLAERISSH